MILSRREKAIITIFILAGCVYLLDHLWFRPLNAQKDQLNAANLSLQAEMERSRRMGVRYGDNDIQQQLMAEYSVMLARIPHLPMIADVLDFVRATALETGVGMCSVQYDDQTQPKSASAAPVNQPIKEIRFKVKVRGHDAQLLDFLERIENAPRLLNVTNTRVTLIEPGNDPSPDVWATADRTEPEITQREQYSGRVDMDHDEYELYAEFSAYFYDKADD